MTTSEQAMESDLRDTATGIADVLRDAVNVLGRVPETLVGVPIYSDGQWSTLAHHRVA